MCRCTLLFFVGIAIACGLDPKKALQPVTLTPLQILGIDDRLGAIEVGKEARLLVSTGDAFGMRSNQLGLADINGPSVNLDDHQKLKAEKFWEKYGEGKSE